MKNESMLNAIAIIASGYINEETVNRRTTNKHNTYCQAFEPVDRPAVPSLEINNFKFNELFNVVTKHYLLYFQLYFYFIISYNSKGN